MSEVSEEVVVYGDAPDAGGGGTDTITVNPDMYSFFVDLGPYVINPVDPTGGGSDKPPKPALKEGVTAAKWAALFGSIAAIIPGVAEAEMAVGITWGVYIQSVNVMTGAAGLYTATLSDDPPQPDYRRPAAAAPRKTSLPAPVTALARPFYVAERQIRLTIDALECAQGAFLAADAPWLQRHVLEADRAYRAAAEGIVAMADALGRFIADLEQSGLLVTPLPTLPSPHWLTSNVSAEDAKRLGVTRQELQRLEDECLPLLKQSPPSVERVKASSAALRRLGTLMTSRRPIDMRFEFGPPPPEAVPVGPRAAATTG